MKLRFGIFLASAIGLWGTGTAAFAADAVMPTKAPPVVVPDVWWLHGYFEVGGRDFLNNPCRNCAITSGQGSLAKYYEYSDIRPGAFLDGHVATGSNNGLYQADVWARNVGYKDQQYIADLSKAGEQYLIFGWDQTPHLYSTSALTLYNGVGSNALTLPAGLSNQLFVASGNANPINPPNAQKSTPSSTPTFIKPISASSAIRGPWSIAIRRRITGTSGRTTPICIGAAPRSKASYSAPAPAVSRVDAPKPIDDTTQNFGASGEYIGTSPWNQKFNLKLAYGGSIYDDSFNSFTVANPFCPTGAGADRLRAHRFDFEPAGAGFDRSQQSGQHVHGDRGRGSAAQEPIHGDAVVQHDAAERGVPALHHLCVYAAGHFRPASPRDGWVTGPRRSIRLPTFPGRA